MQKIKKIPMDDKLVCLIRNVIEEILKLKTPAVLSSGSSRVLRSVSSSIY
jgi:hypothetical protein